MDKIGATGFGAKARDRADPQKGKEGVKQISLVSSTKLIAT
jgi:hypothetical protein